MPQCCHLNCNEQDQSNWCDRSPESWDNVRLQGTDDPNAWTWTTFPHYNLGLETKIQCGLAHNNFTWIQLDVWALKFKTCRFCCSPVQAGVRFEVRKSMNIDHHIRYAVSSGSSPEAIGCLSKERESKSQRWTGKGPRREMLTVRDSNSKGQENAGEKGGDQQKERSSWGWCGGCLAPQPWMSKVRSIVLHVDRLFFTSV